MAVKVNITMRQVDINSSLSRFSTFRTTRLFVKVTPWPRLKPLPEAVLG
ncbi:MAG: hypothetical protein ACYC6F_19290 [Longimicrobiales bacterium]